jgi:Glycosyl transferase family 2
VVLPVWDTYVTDWLSSAVANLASQNHGVAIVVVDNASEVEVPSLPEATVVRSQRRLTRGAARDLGLTHVATEYVVMWDADDVMLPGTLSFLEEAMSSDPELAAFSTAVIEHPSGLRHRFPRRWIGKLLARRSLFALLHCMWSLYPTTGATIMRTELVRAAGGYGDVDSGEDWFLGVSLAFRGGFAWSERPGRVYRIHDKSNWALHATDLGYQLAHARAVRDRLRADGGIPRWVRLSLPLIQIGQYSAIAAHALVTATRRAKASSTRAGRHGPR